MCMHLDRAAVAAERGGAAAADGIDAFVSLGREGAGAGSGSRRPLRIAMVHLSDYRYDSRIQRQAKALAERGDVVDLICLGEQEELRVGEGMVRVHPVRGDKPAGGAKGYLIGYGRFVARAAAVLTALELRIGFDLVEVHNMPDALTFAAIAPKLRGVPVILNLHDTFPELYASKFGRPNDGWGVRLLKIEERLSAALANSLVTVTNEARTRLAERGVGIGRTHVVMNSPDEGVFGPPRAPIGLPAYGEIRILYHGGLAHRYGTESLLQAFARLSQTTPRAVLRVCGAGEDLPMLRGLAASIAPDSITLAGPVPFEAIPAELRAAHIGVVPTLNDRFTELLLPVKLLEYVHAGLPVVASRLPGITGYFSDKDLMLFEPGEPGDLAAAVEAVCSNPVAAGERAAHASERLRAIAWDRQRLAYLQLVDRLVAGRRSRRLPR